MTTEDKTSAIHPFIERLKQEQPRDPDEGNREVDIWIASECGQSPITTVCCGNRVRVDLGPWVGDTCCLAHITLFYRIVGSSTCRQIRLLRLMVQNGHKPDPMKLVPPGIFLNMVMRIG